MAKSFTRRIVSSQPWLDQAADRLQPVVQETVSRAGVKVRDALDGTWLGTPLHPVLTDVPIGAWTAAMTLDAVESVSGSRALRGSADGALAVGIAGGVAAAVTGLSDWRDLRGETRRMGMAHGLLNGVGLTLNITSLGLRAAGRRDMGRTLSTLAFLVSGAAAHLGGELTFGMGVRVNRNAWQSAPEEFTPVMQESELQGMDMYQGTINGTPVLLARGEGGEICAISGTCSHLGGPLAQGTREGDTVICPWHNSRFSLCTGEVIDGPATFPQPSFETRVRDGAVEVRLASNSE